MALTATQSQDLKRHLGLPPTNTILDSVLAGLQDGGTIESTLVTAITLANTTETDLRAAMSNADNLITGGGASFNNERLVAIKERAYNRAVDDLCRMCSFQRFPTQEIARLI